LTRPADNDATDYDAIIIGGSFAGSSAAMLLRRWQPQARVLVIERSQQFTRRVGEATVESSGLFLTRVLGLYDELSRHHLPKHGLRMWFARRDDCPHTAMTEIGPDRLPGLPSFQLDRARLDEHLLHRAGQTGATVVRPGKVKNVQFHWPRHTVTYQDEKGQHAASTRWIIDATGRQGLLSRRLGLREKRPDHPIAAAWGRWQNVKDLDGAFLANDGGENQPGLTHAVASRRLATNHYSGSGWWAWVIPLANGETSIGVVYDPRHFDLPGDGRIPSRYEQFVRRQPGLGQLLENAGMVPDDFLHYQELAYRATHYAGRGWALVGDAASFMDPLYSPGLDHGAFSVYAAADMIRADLTGELDENTLDGRIERHNARFARSYDRWIEALYLDKYVMLGDAELMAAAYCFDIGMYYLGVVASVYRDPANFTVPPMGSESPGAGLAHRLMRLVKKRLVRLAVQRQHAELPRQEGWRFYPRGFELGKGARRLVGQGVRIWLSCECRQLLANGRAKLRRLLRRTAPAGLDIEQQPTAST
jgi:flavin-dependent dehydrogenase